MYPFYAQGIVQAHTGSLSCSRAETRNDHVIALLKNVQTSHFQYNKT